MNLQHFLRHATAAAFSVVALVFAAGCASYDRTTSALPGVTVETDESSGGLHFVTARAQMVEGEPAVTGLVERRLGYSAPWSHLDAIVTDRDGRVLSRTADTYGPRSLGHRRRGSGGRGYYVIRLPATPPGSTVTVRHHAERISQCDADREPPLPPLFSFGRKHEPSSSAK
jgi:hypothetical protein